MGKGAIVQVRLGRSTTRGVVVEVGVEAPAGIKLSAAGKVLDEIPPALVDLALWIADYYGTTPARALELVAPRAADAARGAAVAGGAGVAAGRGGTGRAHARAGDGDRADRRRASTIARRPTSCSSGRPGAARRRCTSRPATRRSRAAAARSCSCRRSRSRRRRSAGSGSASGTRSRSSTRRSGRPSGATSAIGSRAARRESSSARARRSSRRCATSAS